MGEESLVRLALKNLACTQKVLAGELGVSPAQVSKWKAGEHMSFDMEEKLAGLAGIGTRNPETVFWTGGTEQADKWMKLIVHFADTACMGDETGYHTFPLHKDNYEDLCWHVIYILREVGVEIPQQFPSEWDFDYNLDYEDSPEKFEIIFEEHPISSIIYSSFKALTDIYGFYAAYISDIMDDWDLGLMETAAENIESCLLELAFSKVGKESQLMPDFERFKYQTLKNYQQWIELLKSKAYQNGIPLKAELMNLVVDSYDHLGHEAEAQSMGFNSKRLHPDIYMNEILQSHRVIHQILPVICKKLGITEEELKIDSSVLYNSPQ